MTNNPYPEYIGCLVAFETEDGSYYQGKLISIDAEERSITLDKPFKDGYPIREQVKLLGDHMKDLVVKKMPSPPPTPNMLEDDELENFLVYTPSDEVQSDLRPVQSSTVTFDQRFGKPQQNRQKNNNFGLIGNNGPEKKMAQWQTVGKKEPQMKKENVEKQQKVNGSNVKKNGKENAKQEQKNDSRNAPDMKNPDSNEISLAFTKTVYNQEYMKNTENHNKEEPRGMKSLIEQAQSSHNNVENVFEKLKILSHVKETPKNDQTGTSWYQNPLGGLESTANLSPELEKTLVDTLKVMNINISDSQKSAKKQNFMSASRGKFQPAHENLQAKPRESEIEDPLKSLNLQPSGRKPVVIEIAQALSNQRKQQQQQNLAQQSQLQNLTPLSPKTMPSYIKLSNTPDGPQVKPGRRYFMDAKEPKERNDKKNKNQKQSGSQYHKNSRVTVDQLLRIHQNLDHQQEKGCDKETLVSKENDKKNIKNKHDKNARAKIVRSEGSKNVEPETSSHSREQAFDMNFFGSPKSADGKKGGFVSNQKKEVPKNIGQKSSKKDQEKEKTDQKPILSMLFQEPAKGIEEKPLEPIKTPEPIAPSVANFFAQYSALKEEVVIKEFPTVSQEEHATKIEIKNEAEEIAEPPNAGKIPIPLVDTGNLAASSTADSLLNKLFSQFELQEVVKELKEELVSENQAVIDPLIPQPEPEVSSSGSESDTSSNASDEDQSSDETTNESDTTETDTESNSDAEIHSGADSSSTSSQVSEKNEEGTDTEGSQEVPENPPHENLQNEGEAVDRNLAHEEEILPQSRAAAENVLLQEENLAQQATTSNADQSIAADPEIQIPENSLLADPKVAEILKKWPYNKLPEV